MAVKVQEPTVHDLARHSAAMTGTSMTEAVRRTLGHEIGRAELATAKRSRPLVERLDEIAKRCVALPDLDTRSPEEILGYDQNGAPD